jgi:hypothetical protein
MKKSGVLLVILILSILFFLTGTATAERITEILESKVIESFDNPENPEEAEWPSQRWAIRGSKFATRITDDEGNVVDSYPKQTYVQARPEALIYGELEDDTVYRVLGIHGKFDRRGYNFIEIIPVADENDEDGEPIFQPIKLPGKTKIIDLWVWGSNYNYYLEIQVRDYKGIVHVLNLGSLDYTGWKNLSVRIPGSIPQAGGHVTAGGYLKELELIKMVLWTRPEESVEDFYIYFDQIKTLTNTYVQRFDGDNLADPSLIEDVWQSGEGK